MFQQIKKRDGRTVKFNPDKITKAIAGAGLATGEFDEQVAKRLTIQVLNLAQQALNHEVPVVEEIQDIVEQTLLTSPYQKTAKAYIIYREQHTRLRETKDKMSVDLVDQYLSRRDWQVKENSNMAFSLQGLNNYLANEVSKTYWLRKVYPPEIREAYEKGDFHIHDLGILAVYTYYGKEVVVAKIEGRIKLISFEKLYDLIENKERLINEEERVYAKYPKNVYVLDKNGWTEVRRLTRKIKNRGMHFVKNRGGRSVIVTDNHPMITEKGEKTAETITKEDKLFTVDLSKLLKKEKLFSIQEIDLLQEIREGNWRSFSVYFNGLLLKEVSKKENKEGILQTATFAIPRKIKLTEKFGYFVGFALAEGYLSYDAKSSRNISLAQKNKEALLRANEGLLENGISGRLIKRKSNYELEVKNPFLKFLFQEVFKIKTGSKNKTLPVDSLLYNKEFVKGMLGGLIDGDGSIETSGSTISLRISARAMLGQCATLLSLLGFTPRDRSLEGEGTIHSYKGKKIKQNYPLYGVSFRKIKEGLPSEKYKRAKLSKKAWQDETKDSWHIVLNNKKVNIPDDFIYDITTASSTLIVNGMWNHNCVGWDLQDLLLQGFQGVPGKTESTPAKHFRTALGQVVNFFYTLQGEAAGAQAFSNFDTLLAPFIRADRLNYNQVKQALQEFIFNMNVPTRVGFQCLSEDTKILSAEGWKSYNELQEGDIIYTFNTENGQLEKKATDSIFRRKYQGKMFNLRNRNQDQLISPRHRVVRQVFNADKYKLEPIEEVLKYKSPISVPVRGENINSDFPIDDHQLRFLAWTLSEGSIEKEGSRRVSIYQSPEAHPENYREIIGLFDYFGFQYTENPKRSLGTCTQVRALPASSKIIHQWLGATSKKVPTFLSKLSKRQARLFLETYIKGDGWEEKYRKRIVTTDKEILEGLETVAVLAGYNFGVRERRNSQGISKKLQYILTLSEAKHDYIQKIREVDYEGVIWSVHTENETVIAQRNGQVFVTGNTPYTNITLDLTPSPVYKDQPVIIGGELQKETYGDFQEEMNVLNKALLEVMLAGDAKGRVFTFPIPTYNIDPGFDWNNPTIDYLWEATAKYGLPYFANFVNSDMKPEDVRSMCCRLRLDLRQLEKRGGGYFGANPLTGSIGVTTINLPRLGYLSKNKEDFLKRLEKLMVLAKNSLEIKRKLLERLSDDGLYPYSKFYLRATKQRFNAYWKNHFSTIGLIGMNEATLNLLGKDLGEPEAQKFALEVLDFMRDKLVEFQEETGNNYNLEATPAEGTAYRLALKDKKEFSDIICANENEYQKGAEPFYTNSTQLPVNYTDDVFEALDLQDEIQQKYTGGTVFHIFAGERVEEGEVIKKLVRKVCEHYHLPYFTFTPTFSICPTHGYLPGNQPVCPKCGAKTEVYSRSVGYLRPVSQWNEGKAEEFKERKTFKTE